MLTWSKLCTNCSFIPRSENCFGIKNIFAKIDRLLAGIGFYGKIGDWFVFGVGFTIIYEYFNIIY